MSTIPKHILILNAGSSSIKFAMYAINGILNATHYGSVENIGKSNTTLHCTTIATNQKIVTHLVDNNFEWIINYLVPWFSTIIDFAQVIAVGHRIVHGLAQQEVQLITPSFFDEMKKLSQYDPEHLPNEILLIAAITKAQPMLLQLACFDTAFHHTIPHVAKIIPIPKKYFQQAVYRYGFHGISYSYLMQALHFTTDDVVQKQKVILAHLGNGASLAAIKDGICMDTTMGFTPTSGLVMGTRTGDIDPGVAWYLMEIEKLTPTQFNELVNHQSGMLAISETTSNMQEIIKNKNTDTRANDAFNLFCYQTKKFVGAYAAVLEGLNTLVFSGGIGENSPEVRSQICDGFTYLGIEIDEVKNMNNEEIISSNNSRVVVRVIKTNEQLMMAQLVLAYLNKNNE